MSLATEPARAPDAGTDPAVVVEARGLTKKYGETYAVANLDLQIRRGEIFGLLGPNGAGKTTTILMLLGLAEPTAGEVRVLGLDPTRNALSIKRRVGYMPDDVGFYDDLTGRENLHYTARLNRMTKAEATQRVQELLDEVGLADAADRKVGGYSRGMRQRLGLADALVKDPEILILDEPTVNIDPEGVRELMSLVRQLRDRRGVTVMLSSHLLHQVQEVCDRVGIFVAGRLAAVGRVSDLIAESSDRWVLELEIDGPEAGIERAIASVRGATATRDDGRWRVTARRDLRHDLVAALIAENCVPTLLVRREADLDAIYHRYFTEVSHGDRG